YVEVVPRLKVTPNPVVAGETMDASLRGFKPDQAVVIRWRPGNSGPWTQIATGRTSGTGSANIIVTVPLNATPGPYQLRAETLSYNLQTSALTVVAGESQLGA